MAGRRSASTGRSANRKKTNASNVQSSSPIQNIVIVLQENHTFDNYFGTYPGAEGTIGKTICLPNVAGGSSTSNCVAPYHDSRLTPVDMNHDWNVAHADYDNGKMDGFLLGGEL